MVLHMPDALLKCLTVNLHLIQYLHLNQNPKPILLQVLCAASALLRLLSSLHHAHVHHLATYLCLIQHACAEKSMKCALLEMQEMLTTLPCEEFKRALLANDR